jgi:nucleoid-associated protein YgaU
MFFKGSRYERVKDYVALDVRGSRNRVKRMRRISQQPKQQQQPQKKALTYIIKEGDRLDLLAHTYYGDPTKFWLICDANQTMFPHELLVPGKRIIIPREGL